MPDCRSFAAGSIAMTIGLRASRAGSSSGLPSCRALLAKPDWIFLDEATASLDPDAEADLYHVLKQRLPNATLVSIAHRPSVASFHELPSGV